MSHKAKKKTAAPKRKTAASQVGKTPVQKLAKQSEVSLSPAAEKRLREIIQDENNKSLPSLLQTTAAQANSVFNGRGGQMIEFIAETVDEGYDALETADNTIDRKNDMFLTALKRGLELRKKRDDRALAKVLADREAAKAAAQAAAKPARKKAIRRLK